jgi:LEA14-like dessication related protein
LKLKHSILLVAIAMLSACATMNPDYETPSVALTSFKAVPSESMVPAFEVGLRVINPNPGELMLAGVVYTISLEGHEVVKGVGKDFPVIEGYSQQDILLTASVKPLSGIRLISELMGTEKTALDYDFEAKLDVGGLFPSIRVNESGQIDLGATASPR